MASKRTWEQQIMTQIEDEELVTYLGRNHPELSREDHPNFKVYEFSPNQQIDGDNRYYLAGPDWSIIQQSSQLKALHDMLGSRLGYNVTFEQWFEQWEKGFSFGINRTGTTGLKTNYPLQKVGEIPGWREDKSTRPGYLEWKNPNSNVNPNYRTIEYFPDRSSAESIVLTGSDLQIIQAILNYTWQKGSSSSVGRESTFTNSSKFKGCPKINLWFYQKIEDKDINYRLVRGQLGFRFVGKTERWDLVDQGKTTLKKLTVTEIEQAANRIITQFANPTPHCWLKGKNVSSYRDKTIGFYSWSYVNTKQEGVELYTKLLAVAGQTLDRTKLRYTEVDDPNAAFPIDSPNMTILGQKFKGIRKRPYTPVYFANATLNLESLTWDIILTDHQKVVFKPKDLENAAQSWL